jgi:hypothetical protein
LFLEDKASSYFFSDLDTTVNCAIITNDSNFIHYDKA